MNVDNLQSFKDSLTRLETCFADSSKDEIDEVVESFLASNELFRNIVNQFYWEYYSDQYVPEEEHVAAVLIELYELEILTVQQVADLLDQHTAALFLATPAWFASQPNEVGFLQEILTRIPIYHQRMVEFADLLESGISPRK